MKKFVLLLTGPMGAGKSTISRTLAQEIGSCVDIDIEYINFMIPDGFSKTPKEDGSVGFHQWGLSGTTIGLLASHFLNNDRCVVIHGHANQQLVASIESHVHIDQKILLLPSLEQTILRDKARGKDMVMGETWVKESYAYARQNIPSDFKILDTSKEKVDETVDEIKKLLEIDNHANNN